MPAKKDSTLLGILSEYSPKQMSNGQIRMECPFRENHSSDDGKMSFFISPEIGAYHCFSCGAKGSAVKLLTTKFKVNYFEAVELVKLTDYKSKEDKDFELEFKWDLSTPPNDFLDRGFKRDTLRHFRIGTSDDGWIIIPFYMDFNKPAELLGFQKRINHPDRIVLNSKGFKKREYLYNLDHSYEYVVIVEGYSDVMRLYQHGYNAVALLGADMSTWQCMEVSKFKRVYLALDNDNAGRIATEICYHQLKNYTDVMLIPYGTKDPGECKSPKLWRRAFSSATDYVTYSMDMSIGWDGYLDMRDKVIKDLKYRV